MDIFLKSLPLRRASALALRVRCCTEYSRCGAMVLGLIVGRSVCPMQNWLPVSSFTTRPSSSPDSSFRRLCSASLRTRRYWTPSLPCIRLTLIRWSAGSSLKGLATLLERAAGRSGCRVRLCTRTFFWYREEARRESSSKVVSVFAIFISTLSNLLQENFVPSSTPSPPTATCSSLPNIYIDTSLFSLSCFFSLIEDCEKNFLEIVSFLGLLGDILASLSESGLGKPVSGILSFSGISPASGSLSDPLSSSSPTCSRVGLSSSSLNAFSLMPDNFSMALNSCGCFSGCEEQKKMAMPSHNFLPMRSQSASRQLGPNSGPQNVDSRVYTQSILRSFQTVTRAVPSLSFCTLKQQFSYLYAS